MNRASELLTVGIVILALLLIVAYALQGFLHFGAERRRKLDEELMVAILKGEAMRPSAMRAARRRWRAILERWIELFQSIAPEPEERKRLTDFFLALKADLYFIRRLRSRSVYRRCSSAFYLSFLKTVRSQKALTLALEQERKETVKLYQISALCRLDASSSLPDIIDSIKGCSAQFILRVAGLMLDFQSSFIAIFPQLEGRRERELVELIVEYARLAPYRNFTPYLLGVFADGATPSETRQKIFDCLVESYPLDLDPSGYLDDADGEIRARAFRALGGRPSRENADRLVERAREFRDRENAVRALSSMVQQSVNTFVYLVERLENTVDLRTAAIIARTLAGRLDYFLLRSGDADPAITEKIVSEVLDSGKLSDLIQFLNNNHDADIENRIIAILQKKLKRRIPAIDELRRYLNPRVLQKIGISPLAIPQKRVDDKKESIDRTPLYIALAGVFLIPILIFARDLAVTPGQTVAGAAREAINGYLYAFSWYAFAVTCFYLFLTFQARLEAGKQRRFLKIKDTSFMYRKNMLPSISILAPAYNEELSIVNSVESLLNVNYPDFEIIVVNDGSKDRTLELLVSHFKLEKTDLAYRTRLQTQPVRGIYVNPHVPGLTVIDKINGGKADSLNVGINAAKGEYILGIDSDSILDRDSLLVLASAFLDEETKVVASGGNIMPVNGCTVDRGIIVKKRIPSTPVPLLQTIEYYRAFMNGRLGWSRLNTLMIISGAFGIFRREEVIAISGYLTSREKYEKDTVGEDMELVIRLSRQLQEQRIPHRILYNFQSHCWTEVPDSMRILKRQRDRWQRGLIQILSFHKRMIGNPRYGRYGLVGFPYFALVEVIGPWFELLGILAFACGLATGWLYVGVLAFYLATNLLFSFALSVASLYIGDFDRPQFPVRDRLVLVLTSLAETFGFRQIISFFRITGFIGVLRNITGWGNMTRRGFRPKGGRRQ